MEWMILPLKRYAQFSGRSRRQEYWMFVLFQMLIYIALGIVAVVLGAGAAGLASGGTSSGSAGMMGMFAALGVFLLVYGLVGLAFLVPNLAVIVRRLHDTERSGKWLLAVVVPYVLGYVLSIVGAASQSNVLAMVGGLVAVIGMIGGLVLLVFMCLDGTPGPNRYGADPKGRGEATTAY